MGREKTSMASPTATAEQLCMPFDQYGRYRMAQEALDAVRPLLGERLRLLDVGGFFRTRRGIDTLPVRAFLPHDEVIVLDQPHADLEGYRQGDGRHLAFDDHRFDVVLSCDTLEHVPAPDRPAFWRELLRVARHGVLLAAPFASDEVVAAEALLFRYIQAELGLEQQQLKEHAAYGLPDLQATRAMLEQEGLPHLVYPSGYVHAWLVMMVIKHYMLAQSDDHDLHEQLDAYYTRFFAASERREPAYRHFVVVAHPHEQHHAWLAAVDAALAPTIQHEPAEPLPGWPEYTHWLLQLLWMRHEERRTHALSQTIATQAHTIAGLQQALAEREARVHDLEQQAARVHDLEQRAAWLQQQAEHARHALQAVEQGRVLRLLRWLQGTRPWRRSP
jgi:uncharacterized coiled-coil protein SlyX